MTHSRVQPAFPSMTLEMLLRPWLFSHTTRGIIMLCLWLAGLLGATAAPASETIRSLVALSDVVLVGTITEAPNMMQGSSPLGAPEPKPYWLESIARIKVGKVLKGSYRDGPESLISLRVPMVTQVIRASPLSFSSPGVSLRFPPISAAFEPPPPAVDPLAPFAKGKKILFFLQDRRLREELGKAGKNHDPIFLVAFDPYLSALPYSEALEHEIAETE
jgi:hypothetical protein